MTARQLIEAENPKRALQKSKTGGWKPYDHMKGSIPKENGPAWSYEDWFFTKGKFSLYVEAIDENPGHPPGVRWHIGLGKTVEDRWRKSGDLTNAMGEIEYGLTYEQAVARAFKWANGNLTREPNVSEAEEPKKPEPAKPVRKGGESPKAFFLKKKPGMTGSAGAEEILQYMPPEFVRAYRSGREATWDNPYAMDSDWWPSYDSDDDTWTQYIYYWDYYTVDGKLYGLVMSGDRDGNHDVNDEAEVGTPEYKRLEQEYGPEAWQKAMNDYYRWVVENRRDPLGYISIPRVPVKKEWIAGFKKEGDQLKLIAVRRKKQEPAAEAIQGEELVQLARTDPDVKEALEYLLVDPSTLTTSADETDLLQAGGKWDNKQRLIIHFEIEKEQAAADYEDQLVRIAGAGLE